MTAMQSGTYIVDSLVGEGGFGKVKKCIRIEDMKTVAIKMQKINPRSVNQIQGEITSLFKLRELDPDKCNIVRFYEAFHNNGELYLVFEYLDKNLLHFMKERERKTLLLKEIRPIVCQLANAFNHLSSLGLIHTDIKLDNVMFVDHIKYPYRVKLIDFGLAIDVSAAKTGSRLQARACRSPEIILGLPFTEAIDMWSLGMMSLTMFLGQHLYSSETEYDLIKNIVGTLGQPPDHMLCHGLNSQRYFKRDTTSASFWRLKTPKEYKTTGIPLKATRGSRLTSLDDLLHVYPVNHEDYADKTAERNDLLMFLDMLKKMLQLDPKKRTTPSQVLCHPFITGFHLVSLHTISPHATWMMTLEKLCTGLRRSPPRGLPIPFRALVFLNPCLANRSHCQSNLNKSAGIKRKGSTQHPANSSQTNAASGRGLRGSSRMMKMTGAVGPRPVSPQALRGRGLLMSIRIKRGRQSGES